MKRTSKYFKFGAVAALALALVVGACKDDDNKLPAIDGYNNSDEVGSDNLVAHWTFDNDQKEVISGTAPANSYGTVAQTDGKLGKALMLTGGALVYPSIDKINSADALGNVTISMWLKVKNTKRGTGAFTPLFGVFYENSGFWPNIGMNAETGRHLVTSDTLELKNYMTTLKADGSTSEQDNLPLFNTDKADKDHPNGQTGAWFLGAQDWVHYVLTWDGTTHKFEVYANGKASGGYTNRDAALGALKMQVPAKAAFGTLAFKDVGFKGDRPDWCPLANATIDDVRIYNTALSQAEITALFNLGTAGR